MAYFTNPLMILAILCFNIAISELLVKKTRLRLIGTALLVIIITAVAANFNIIPSASNPSVIYKGIFKYVAPIAIFFLLLQVNIRNLKKAGMPMLIMFVIGSIGTMIGVVCAMWIVSGEETIGAYYYAICGMFTGTYTGGSINFNAIALHYDVTEQGNLYAGSVAVDNIISALWMVATLILPKLLSTIFKRKFKPPIDTNEEIDEYEHDDTETLNPLDISFMLCLGILMLWISDLLRAIIFILGVDVPSIIIITTFALILAQIPAISSLKGCRLLGMFSVYLFLAVIGAYCELSSLVEIGSLAVVLLSFTVILVLIHGIITFGVGALLKYDWNLIAVASQANIGGSTTALALSKSLNRSDLILPGILVGSLGNGIGTYLGFMVAEMLK